jgi:hypothetical protein
MSQGCTLLHRDVAETFTVIPFCLRIHVDEVLSDVAVDCRASAARSICWLRLTGKASLLQNSTLAATRIGSMILVST